MTWVLVILVAFGLAALIFWAVHWDAKHGDDSLGPEDWRTY